MEIEDYFRQMDHERWSYKRILAFVYNRIIDDQVEDLSYAQLELYTEKIFKFMIMNGVCDPRDIDEAAFTAIIES